MIFFLEYSYTLMFVSTFLYQVQIHLVSDVKLMASVAKAQLRGVPFITVTQNDAMEATPHKTQVANTT